MGSRSYNRTSFKKNEYEADLNLIGRRNKHLLYESVNGYRNQVAAFRLQPFSIPLTTASNDYVICSCGFSALNSFDYTPYHPDYVATIRQLWMALCNNERMNERVTIQIVEYSKLRTLFSSVFYCNLIGSFNAIVVTWLHVNGCFRRCFEYSTIWSSPEWKDWGWSEWSGGNQAK